jgi:4-amino-4-deoxy-L-arabinose transferase-like glycosyltransferase
VCGIERLFRACDDGRHKSVSATVTGQAEDERKTPIDTGDPPARGQLDRAARMGLAAIALATFLLCCAVTIAKVPLGTTDESAHLDYALQIWHGHLPVFERGLSFRAPLPSHSPPVQWEAQHPPFFYALVAPIAGPLIDAGHWIVADLAVRLVNSVLSALSVLAIAWAAGAAVSRNRSRWMLLTGAVATMLGPIIFVGGSAFSDPVLTLTSALAVGIALRAVRHGLDRRTLVLAALIAAVGAAARAEFVIALGILVLGLAAAACLHSRGSAASRLGRALLASSLPIVAAAASSGWFYLRNKRLTGTFSGSQPEWAAIHLHRKHRSVSEVLHLENFWNTQFALLRHPLDGRYTAHHARNVIDTRTMVTMLVVLLVLGVLFGVRSLWRAVRGRDRVQLVTIGLLALLAFITFAYEVFYITGGGGSVSRYLLPAALPICMAMAAGLRALPRLVQPAALGLALALSYSMFAFWLIVTPHTGGAFGKGPTHVPWIFAWATLPLVAICAVVQVYAVAATGRRDR